MCVALRKWSRDNLTNLGKKSEAVKYTKGYFLRVVPQEKEEEEEAIDININTRDEAFKDPRVRTDNGESSKKEVRFVVALSRIIPHPSPRFPKYARERRQKKIITGGCKGSFCL